MSSTLRPSKVYVLTIPRLLERQTIFKEAWDKAKIDIEFFQGYDYRDSIDNKIIDNEYYNNNIPHLYIGSSFYKLFKYLLTTGEDRWFVCEDDARPTFRWYNFNWSLLEPYKEIDIIKLYAYEFAYINDGEIRVMDTTGTGVWIGACSFIITRIAIEKLLKTPLFYPFDRLMAEICTVMILRPNIVVPYSKSSSY